MGDPLMRALKSFLGGAGLFAGGYSGLLLLGLIGVLLLAVLILVLVVCSEHGDERTRRLAELLRAARHTDDPQRRSP